MPLAVGLVVDQRVPVSGGGVISTSGASAMFVAGPCGPLGALIFNSTDGWCGVPGDDDFVFQVGVVGIQQLDRERDDRDRPRGALVPIWNHS
jgi:hypothetical protein